MAQIGLKKGVYLKDHTYKIESVLGQGTFGITYLATAKVITEGNLGKIEVEAKVAIKEFFMSEVNSRKEDSSDVDGSSGSVFSNYRRKFRKEAENLSKLSHKGIVKVLDVFDENNTTYYVMEYIDGMNLDDYIREKGRIPEKEAIEIIKEVGDALSYMHSRRMLHLDLKPKNIMRKNDGSVCLIDFGLSKQFTDGGEPESSTSIGLGTPGYAPLEQAHYKHGSNFPATLDVYALGATFFKMLTGRRVPDASAILNEGFPEEEVIGHVSGGTVRVLKHAMNPFSKDRTATINDFINALEGDMTEIAEPSPGSNKTEETTNYREPEREPEKEQEINPIYDAPNNSVNQNNSFSHNSHIPESKTKKHPKDLLTTIVIVVGTALLVVLLYWLFRAKANNAEVVSDQDSTEVSVVLNEKIIKTVTDMEWNSPLGEAIYSGEITTDSIDTNKVIPHGNGVAKIVSGKYEGNTYEGEFSYGNMDGRAKYTQKNGDVYVGRFKNNQYDRGRYKLKSTGQYYEGTFHNGEPEKGNWYDKNGNKM